MPETDIYKHPFKSQERHEWYQINSFLQKVGQAGVELDLQPKDMVHIGGTGNFYRLYAAFGPSATIHFRGTHDMDIVSFNQGVARRVLDRIKGMPDSPILDYTIRKSPNIPDKMSIYVALNSKNMPGLSTGFELDVYESSTGLIRFNKRLFTAERLILDPPEKLILPPHRGFVIVPSLRDYFIIKMDIVDYSKSGLRSKDQVDILATLATCDKTNVEFSELLEALIQTSSPKSVSVKLNVLERLFSDPAKVIPGFPKNFQFLPDPSHLDATLALVRSFKNHSNYK